MANEPQAYSTFVVATLTADPDVSALVGDRIYEDLAPDDPTFPYVVFGQSQATDEPVIGSDERIWTIPLYYVRAVVQDSSYAVADQVADAIDEALRGLNGVVEIRGRTYQIRGVHRTSPLRFPELDEGIHYRHSGGLYRANIHTEGA